MSRTTRRRFLVGGGLGLGLLVGAAAGVEEGVLPGRSRVYSVLGLDGDEATIPSARAGPQVSGTFTSHRRRTEVGWTIAYPPGSRAGDAVPVVVGLHGRFADHTSLFADQIGLDRFLAVDHQPFAIAAVDGGDTYWHRRASGEDAGTMVTDEFLPLLADHGLRTGSIGLYGQDDLRGIAVRVDCGRGDGFAPATQRYRAGFDRRHRPAGGLQAGAHDVNYWRRAAPAELAFLGLHLT